MCITGDAENIPHWLGHIPHTFPTHSKHTLTHILNCSLEIQNIWSSFWVVLPYVEWFDSRLHLLNVIIKKIIKSNVWRMRWPQIMALSSNTLLKVYIIHLAVCRVAESYWKCQQNFSSVSCLKAAAVSALHITQNCFCIKQMASNLSHTHGTLNTNFLPSLIWKGWKFGVQFTITKRLKIPVTKTKWGYWISWLLRVQDYTSVRL
jgi:hypothetical protein